MESTEPDPLGSPLGVLVGRPGTAGDPLVAAEERARAIPLAIRLGTRFFDLSEHPDPSAELAWLRGAARASPAPISVLLAWEALAAGGSEALGGARDPGPLRITPVVRGDAIDSFESAQFPAGTGTWIVDLPGPEVEEVRWSSALARGARWARIPATLLRAEEFERSAARLRALGVGVLAVDPFDRGRFDGSFLLTRSPFGAPPVAGEEGRLRAHFAPALPYGFLAIPKRRTLAQATVQYFLQVSGVAALALAVARPEGLVEAWNARSAPPLTGEEVARIRSLSRSEPREADATDPVPPARR